MEDLLNYLDGYKGNAVAGDKAIASGETVRLPDEPCRFVILWNWTTTAATALPEKSGAAGPQPEDAADDSQLHYGFNGIMCGQLFVGEHTPLLPVNNASQITARLPSGVAGRVHYAIFR